MSGVIDGVGAVLVLVLFVLFAVAGLTIAALLIWAGFLLVYAVAVRPVVELLMPLVCRSAEVGGVMLVACK